MGLMTMENQGLVQIFSEIAIFLKMEGVPFRPQAYEKAAFGLETLDRDVREVYEKDGRDGLKKITGVGETIAERIEEYLKTGKIRYYQELKKKTPINLAELTGVEGLGPKMVKDLWLKLKIKNLKDLERAARAGRIRRLPNFGEKTEANILQGIVFLKKSRGRFLLGQILPEVREIVSELKKLKAVEEISLAGSLRRGKETIGDADILVISREAKKVTDLFINLPGVAKVWGQGKTKSSIRSKGGFDIDLRIVPEKSFGAALQYFTGSKEHNIALRQIAIGKELKLNEYGLFRGPKMTASRKEEDIYHALGLPWIEPELREGRGEIEAALNDSLPKLIDCGDIKGDLHCHSSWDGGRNTILEMARAAQEIGYQYLGIADHTKFLRIEHGLDEKQLSRQRKEIDRLNASFVKQKIGFRILQGCEANILKSGKIDIRDESLSKLDYVIAGVHSNLKMNRSEMTQRLIRAMENPHVDIISHPTGRILQRRDEYEIDFEALLKAARQIGTILEINSSPERLDLKDSNIRLAKKAGVKMIINTDSHSKDQLGLIEFGISQARRGWAEKKDIVNCWPREKMLGFLKQENKTPGR